MPDHRPLTLMLVCGEPSGDRLGAELMAAIHALAADVQIAGVGGPAMAAQGLQSLFPLDDTAVMGLREVVPRIPAIHKRFWLTKQVMLTAMQFMLAATAAGLATLPMEGFDEGRVRRVLGIPRSQIVPVIIPVGYPALQDLKKTRLTIGPFVHRDGWKTPV